MVEDVWEKVGADLPDGEYEGTWCGRMLDWKIGDRCFRAEMPKAIRGRTRRTTLEPGSFAESARIRLNGARRTR